MAGGQAPRPRLRRVDHASAPSAALFTAAVAAAALPAEPGVIVDPALVLDPVTVAGILSLFLVGDGVRALPWHMFSRCAAVGGPLRRAAPHDGPDIPITTAPSDAAEAPRLWLLRAGQA